MAATVAVASIGLGPAAGATTRANARAVVSRPVTAWVTSQGEGTVTPIDVTTGVAGTPIDAFDGVGAPYRIAATPDGSAVWITLFGDNSVRRIDTATGALGDPILLGADRHGNPMGIAITPNGKTAFVSDYSYTGDGVVYPIDLATGTVGAAIEPHAELGQIAITPDGRTAWVIEDTGAIAPINVASGKVGKPFVLGGAYPQSIAIAPDGLDAYVVGYQSGNPAVVQADLATRTVGWTAPVAGLFVDGVAVSPDGTVVYASGDGVTPIDAATGVAGPVISPARDELPSVAFTPDGKIAYTPMFRDHIGHALRFDVVHARQRGGATVGTGATGVAITPDQAPVAAFHVARATAGSPSTFDASASQAVSSPIAHYHWDFGDGSSADAGSATTTHTYAEPGTYTVVLTLTDAAGTSTARVYTGQTMSRNGSRVATRSHSVTID